MSPTFTVEIEGEAVILRSTENASVMTTIFPDAPSIRRLGKFLADFEDPTPVEDDGEPSQEQLEGMAERNASSRAFERRGWLENGRPL